jgi:hypothetical protein
MLLLNVFVYINECIDVNTALKKSFKSMVETTCLVALNMSCLSEGKEKSF